MPTDRFTKGGFKVGQLMVYLAKIGKLKIVYLRELPNYYIISNNNQRLS